MSERKTDVPDQILEQMNDSANNNPLKANAIKHARNALDFEAAKRNPEPQRNPEETVFILSSESPDSF